MLTRRSFNTLLAAAAASSMAPKFAKAQKLEASNVVLVHGLYADGSCWIDVIPYLQKAGLNVTAVQNPLTSLADAAAATRRILALQKGPTVLVGHSFAGTIISETGNDSMVSALVYVAARAPDAGEDCRNPRLLVAENPDLCAVAHKSGSEVHKEKLHALHARAKVFAGEAVSGFVEKGHSPEQEPEFNQV